MVAVDFDDQVVDQRHRMRLALARQQHVADRLTTFEPVLHRGMRAIRRATPHLEQTAGQVELRRFFGSVITHQLAVAIYQFGDCLLGSQRLGLLGNACDRVRVLCHIRAPSLADADL